MSNPLADLGNHTEIDEDGSGTTVIRNTQTGAEIQLGDFIDVVGNDTLLKESLLGQADGVAGLDANAVLESDQIPASVLLASQLGVADGVAELNGDAVLPSSQVPPLSITETFTVADETERLALDVQEGDVAVQQDNSTTYLFTGGDPSLNENWSEIVFDVISEIAGKDIDPNLVTADGAEIASKLGIPVYSDDTNAPNESQYFDSSDGLLEYKDSNGTIFAGGGLQPGEDFDGQGTSSLTNLAEMGTDSAAIGTLSGQGDVFRLIDRQTPESDTTQIQFTGLSNDTEYKIFLTASSGGADTWRMRINGDGPSTGNYDYWDAGGTKQSSQNDFLIADSTDSMGIVTNINISNTLLGTDYRTGFNQNLQPGLARDLSDFGREGGNQEITTLNSVELIADNAFVGGFVVAELWERDWS